MTQSYYWHDYETWGGIPAKDRPCQFAGIRTDTDLNPVGEPLVLFSRPADDLLPQPDACLVTGITPQHADREGIPEAEFAIAIQRELAAPATCAVGYNNLRFDDEVTRYLFYRNLLDPYAHTYRNGNSRWDLIDVLRLAHALRPDGIQWPEREPGVTSFKLEDLTAANGIDHADAHDALADVRATIAMARLLKQAQPRLFDYALSLRNIDKVRELLDQGKPVLHVSQRYPAIRGAIAPVMVVGTHPANPKQWLCFDLRQDPASLLDLEVEQIRECLFRPSTDLPADLERIPIKGIRINASPMLAPIGTLGKDAAERWEIDLQQIAVHAQRINQARSQIASKLLEVYQGQQQRDMTDPDLMLYAGGFFSNADRRRMETVHQQSPAKMGTGLPRFDDPRLPTLLFRMRARSWPETLSETEREDWDAWRLERLTDPDADGFMNIDEFEQRIAELRAQPTQDTACLAILDQLQHWAEGVMDAGC